MLKAYFTYVTAGLSIGFVNLSSGNPDVFSWEFGSSTSSSNTKSPVFLYPLAGVYEVTLTVSKASEPEITDTIILLVNVTATGTPSPYPIFLSLKNRTPQVLLPTDQVLDNSIKKWQLTLADLVTPAIPESTIYDESVWPNLVNELILNLVMYDLVTDALVNMSYAASAAAQGISASTEEGVGSGGLKSIETGPAKAEFYDLTASSSEATANLAKTFQAGGGKDFLGLLGSRICLLAARCRIPLEICPDLSQPTIAPLLSRTFHLHHHNH